MYIRDTECKNACSSDMIVATTADTAAFSGSSSSGVDRATAASSLAQLSNEDDGANNDSLSPLCQQTLVLLVLLSVQLLPH